VIADRNRGGRKGASRGWAPYIYIYIKGQFMLEYRLLQAQGKPIQSFELQCLLLGIQ